MAQSRALKNEEKYFAVNAIDKDLSTVAILEPLNGESWLKLEFDETHFIHKIVIYYQFYTDWSSSSEYWCTKKETNWPIGQTAPAAEEPLKNRLRAA